MMLVGARNEFWFGREKLVELLFGMEKFVDMWLECLMLCWERDLVEV
jgi:hypothetical protein